MFVKIYDHLIEVHDFLFMLKVFTRNFYLILSEMLTQMPFYFLESKLYSQLLGMKD